MFLILILSVMWGLPKKMSGKFCNKISPVSWLLFYQKLNVLQLSYFLLVATLVLWNLKSKNKLNVSSAWGLKLTSESDMKRVDGFVMSDFKYKLKPKKKTRTFAKMWTRLLCDISNKCLDAYSHDIHYTTLATTIEEKRFFHSHYSI